MSPTHTHHKTQPIRQTLALIRRHALVLLSMGTALQFLVSGLGAGLLVYLFRLALIAADQTNLDKNNISHLLANPLSIGILLVLGAVFALLFYLELSAMAYVIDACRQGKRLSYRGLLTHSLGRLKSLTGLDFVSFFGYLLITLPVSGAVLESSLTEGFYVPDFITGELMKTPMGAVLVGLVFLVLSYLNLRLIYTVPLMVIGDQAFSQSLKMSWQATRQGKRKLVGALLGFELVLALVSFLVMALGIALAFLIYAKGDNLWFQAGVLTLYRGVNFAFGLFTKVGVMSILLIFLGRPLESQPYLLAQAKGKRGWRFYLLLALLGAMAYGSAAFEVFSGGLNSKQQVVAHRGYVAEGVENTIPALEAAAAQGVDQVEMDILLTKDLQFVVMHDYNLKRLAGIDRRVQDMTLAEVEGLTVHQDGLVATIPSFDAYVKRAKELGIKLLVELKPHGGEPDNYAQIFIDKMRQLGVETHYKTMSLDLKVMEEIERLAPEIETGYVIPIQLGGFGDNQVDFFVIEDFSYQDYLADQAHDQGKAIYVWTINDNEKIRKYLQKPVDAIITDQPDQVASIRQKLQSHQSNYLDYLLQLASGN